MGLKDKISGLFTGWILTRGVKKGVKAANQI
jgi:hypothetical protein